MGTNIKLENLKKELDYFRVDYESKMAQNKIECIKYCLEKFVSFIEQKDFIISNKDLEFIAHSIELEIKIFPQYDYNTNPRQGRGIKIEKTEFQSNKKTEYLIRIFDNKPLPTPDLKRLLANPYKNMSIDEVEIFEKEKDLKYFKEYISEIETREYTEYITLDLTNEIEYGLAKDIQKCYEIILK